MPEPILIKAKCRSCGAPIFWASTPNGRACPFDFEPVLDGDNTISAWGVKKPDGTAINVVMGLYDPVEDADEARYQSHFKSCPDAAGHSKKAKP